MVLHASASHSTTASWRKPAYEDPNANPPAPAKSSIDLMPLVHSGNPSALLRGCFRAATRTPRRRESSSRVSPAPFDSSDHGNDSHVTSDAKNPNATSATDNSCN